MKGSSVLTCCHWSVAIVVLTSTSQSATYHLFNIPWERGSWALLLGCHYAYSEIGPLAVQSLFSTFFRVPLPTGTRSSLQSDYHKIHLIWVDSSLVVTFQLSFVFSVFGHRSPGPASPPDHHENHLIWVIAKPDGTPCVALVTAQIVHSPT